MLFESLVHSVRTEDPAIKPRPARGFERLPGTGPQAYLDPAGAVTWREVMESGGGSVPLLDEPFHPQAMDVSGRTANEGDMTRGQDDPRTAAVPAAQNPPMAPAAEHGNSADAAEPIRKTAGTVRSTESSGRSGPADSLPRDMDRTSPRANGGEWPGSDEVAGIGEPMRMLAPPPLPTGRDQASAGRKPGWPLNIRTPDATDVIAAATNPGRGNDGPADAAPASRSAADVVGKNDGPSSWRAAASEEVEFRTPPGRPERAADSEAKARLFQPPVAGRMATESADKELSFQEISFGERVASPGWADPKVAPQTSPAATGRGEVVVPVIQRKAVDPAGANPVAAPPVASSRAIVPPQEAVGFSEDNDPRAGAQQAGRFASLRGVAVDRRTASLPVEERHEAEAKDARESATTPGVVHAVEAARPPMAAAAGGRQAEPAVPSVDVTEPAISLPEMRQRSGTGGRNRRPSGTGAVAAAGPGASQPPGIARADSSASGPPNLPAQVPDEGSASVQESHRAPAAAVMPSAVERRPPRPMASPRVPAGNGDATVEEKREAAYRGPTRTPPPDVKIRIDRIQIDAPKKEPAAPKFKRPSPRFQVSDYVSRRDRGGK